MITGIRFYKAAANTGTHIGSLWTRDGQRLAQATFTGESASGWQTVTFANPVEVSPDTTYVASYFAPNGHYSATPEYFYRTPAPGPNGGAIADSPPLHALRNTRHDRQRRLRLRRQQHVPDRTATAPPTTGSTSASRRSRRRARPPT